ncbi:ribosome recycling factor [candidate division CSSED10-310 bacterium]|uniref:Ribosome-recycling factor n=1 Tax=candidate division CSSED10-310 bacterium TaxID=2855610 RepID=A0ABV6YW50_UNCC1
MVLDDLYEDLGKRMQTAIKKLNRNFQGLRTGRASTSLLDNIRLDYYGASTPLNQVATLTVPEYNLIVIQPWDGSVLSDIEKAINKSNLGLIPMSDGKLIRINIPPLTEERRKELAKAVRKYAEECKIAIRNIRRDGNEEVKFFEKEKEISEDMAYKGLAEIVKITESYIEEVDKLLLAKEDEILKF